MKMIETIRNRIDREELDYQILVASLGDYARPRDKISDLLEKGCIVRIKKGLYVFGDEYRRRPYSREILANLIYGPSYISLDFALQHYGLIPERVEALTSVTTGRSRRFFTPVGLFTYHRIPLEAFRIGMDRVEIGDGMAFLVAEPEKALADKLNEIRGSGIRSRKELDAYLGENLRIDPDALKKLNPEKLAEIARRYQSRGIKMLSDLVRGMRGTKKKGVPSA